MRLNKFIMAACLCITTFFAFGSKSLALDITSTYGHVPSTGSNVINLINYANSYDSFLDSDFVVFQDEQYSWYIVWGDLEFENDRVYNVGDSDIEYIRYYRTSTTGYNNTYIYAYGLEASFTLESEHVNTSNLDNYGFMSAAYDTYFSNYQITMFLIFIGSFLFAIMFVLLRRKL